MKILFAGSYNDKDTFTGPEKVARRIFDSFSGNSPEYQTTFISYFSDGNIYGIFKKLFGQDFISSEGNGNILRLGIFRMFLFALKYRPDVIHIINFERFPVLLYIFRLFRKVKIVYNVHGIAAFEDSTNNKASQNLKSKDRFCEKIYFRYSDTLIFLSELSKTTARKFYDFDDSKAVIIPNGIDKEFYEAGKAAKPKSERTLKIVFIGEILKKEKGFTELISALFKIDFSIELFAISDSSPDSILLSEINDSSNINFHLTDKMDTEKYAEFLSNKDIYISPSTYEQFSIAAVESMAAGLVPVVSVETGMNTYIDNGVNGIVYNNETELISILNKLNYDRDSIFNISEKAKLIYNELNTEKIFQKYKNVYK